MVEPIFRGESDAVNRSEDRREIMEQRWRKLQYERPLAYQTFQGLADVLHDPVTSIGVNRQKTHITFEDRQSGRAYFSIALGGRAGWSIPNTSIDEKTDEEARRALIDFLVHQGNLMEFLASPGLDGPRVRIKGLRMAIPSPYQIPLPSQRGALSPQQQLWSEFSSCHRQTFNLIQHLVDLVSPGGAQIRREKGRFVIDVADPRGGAPLVTACATPNHWIEVNGVTVITREFKAFATITRHALRTGLVRLVSESRGLSGARQEMIAASCPIISRPGSGQAPDPSGVVAGKPIEAVATRPFYRRVTALQTRSIL